MLSQVMTIRNRTGGSGGVVQLRNARALNPINTPWSFPPDSQLPSRTLCPEQRHSVWRTISYYYVAESQTCLIVRTPEPATANPILCWTAASAGIFREFCHMGFCCEFGELFFEVPVHQLGYALHGSAL